jgi:hypothetical protein
MNELTTALKNFEVAISELTTSLEGAHAKAVKMKLPESCHCAHCVNHLETVEGITIPQLTGQIASIRAVMGTLRHQIEDEE